MDFAENILYEDDEILIVHKQSQIAVQTKRLTETDLEHMLRNYRASKGEEPYIGIVHRLDQPVEGVMVFAKNKSAAAALSRQMQEGVFEKYYYAIVWGSLREPNGKLTDYIKKDGKTNTSMVCDRSEKGAKRASLTYETVGSDVTEDGVRTLLRIRLESGRHHQIRVQMMHAGCPLVGDGKYNPKRADTVHGRYIALCAYRLAFFHPRTGNKVCYEIVPSGDAFQNF